MPRASIASMYGARDVLAEADEPAEQHRDVARLIGTRFSEPSAWRSPTCQPFFSSTSQAMNAPTASGSDDPRSLWPKA